MIENDGWSIIHAFWMSGSMGTPSLLTGRPGFVVYPGKGWLGIWMDAWVSDSSTNTASVANAWVNGPYTYQGQDWKQLRSLDRNIDQNQESIFYILHLTWAHPWPQWHHSYS